MKLMQNETNRWSIFLLKTKLLVKLLFKGQIITIFSFFIITNFKTDRH